MPIHAYTFRNIETQDFKVLGQKVLSKHLLFPPSNSDHTNSCYSIFQINKHVIFRTWVI